MPEFYEYESGDPYAGYVPTAAQAAVLKYPGKTLEQLPSAPVTDIQVGSIPAGTELQGLWAAGEVGATAWGTPPGVGGVTPAVVGGIGAAGLAAAEAGTELGDQAPQGIGMTGAGIIPVGGPGLLLAGAAGVTLGFLKSLWAAYGPTVLKMLVGGATFGTIVKMITGGVSDDTVVKLGGKRKKRYSIGTNPRMNTLLKVAKRVDNIFISYDKRMTKFRSRIKGPRKPARQPRYGPTAYLSRVERKQLTGGRG